MNRFLIVACSVAVVCALLGVSIPELGQWARALGARSIAEAGLLALVRAQVDRQLLGRHRHRVPTSRSDRLSCPDHRHDALAGSQEPGRVDLAVGGAPGGQPVLVPGQGGNARPALSPPGHPHDVPPHDGRPPPARDTTPAGGHAGSSARSVVIPDDSSTLAGESSGSTVDATAPNRVSMA